MKDRKVEQFKQEHFKHPLFLGISLEIQRPYLKDLLCVAVVVSFEAGCVFFPHSSSQQRRNERLVPATVQRFTMQSNLHHPTFLLLPAMSSRPLAPALEPAAT